MAVVPLTLDTLPDIASLRRVQTALWQAADGPGAALMVGAGLSRAALSSSGDAKPVPLWSDLAKIMSATIYPEGGAPTDPLRLAQEYEAALDRNAIDNLIRTRIDDPSRTPGDLHRNLVNLPWRDILTTNYDTLLERAVADNPDKRYAVVRTVAEISRSSAPRIVKLHGTLPSHTPFVITEDDFRRYPTRAAPFVNLAQQVLMENVLCLVGFSGDDPNFLVWTGWVRDHLGPSAPTVYLVGALNLSVAKRKMLEARRVAPIDLYPLVADLERHAQHNRAVELFVESLIGAKPWPIHRWPSQKKPRPAKPVTTDKKELPVQEWKTLRESYPGWVVAPFSVRFGIMHDTEWARHNQKSELDAMPLDKRRAALFEYGWRLDLALSPLPDSLVAPLSDATTSDTDALPAAQREQIGFWLLRHARETSNAVEFARWAEWLEKSSDSDTRAKAAWERCLDAKSRLDLIALEKHLPGISGADPFWHVRRASFLAHLNREREAFDAVRQTLIELRTRQAQDRESIWIASRLAWALYVYKQASFGSEFRAGREEFFDAAEENWPSYLVRLRCDPSTELRIARDSLREQMDKKVSGSVEIKESFDPGASTVTEYTSQENKFSESSRLRRLLDASGVPRSLGHVNLVGDALTLACTAEGVETAEDLLNIIQAAPGRDLLDKMLPRLVVVRLPKSELDKSIDLLQPAAEDALRRTEHAGLEKDNWRVTQAWSGLASRITEALSRLLVRADEAKIKSILKWGFEIAASTKAADWGFFEPLEHLLERALKALSPDERQEFLLSAVELPLPGEKPAHLQEHHWPELIFAFKNPKTSRGPNETHWARRIAQLIAVTRTNKSLDRERSILRLSQLYRWNILQPAEAKEFGVALWEHREGVDGLPSKTGLLAHVILTLPEPTPGIARQAFAKHIAEPTSGRVPTLDQMMALSNAARFNPTNSQYHLTNQEAVVWLANLLKFERPQGYPRFGAMRGHQQIEKQEAEIGWALTRAVVPYLNPEDLDEKNIDRMTSDSVARSVVIALPEVLVIRPDYLPKATGAVRRALAMSDANIWHAGACAYMQWLELHDASKIPAPPSDFSSQVVRAVLHRDEETLLMALAISYRLVERKQLEEIDLSHLENGLTYLFEKLRYESADASKVMYLSLLRKNCVLLAIALRDAGRAGSSIAEWIAAGLADPLPEVRHAAAGTNDEYD